jgi:ankyrin repeat protein
MVKALLAKGADPSLRGPSGANAHSLAKESGNAEMVNLLESQGARP